MAENRKSISELTELPGNLSLAALLAVVQGGVTYHATGEQVSNMVLGNISVVENATTGQFNIRFPGSGIQLDINPAVSAVYANASRLTSEAATDTYLRAFSAAPTVAVTLPQAGYTNVSATVNNFVVTKHLNAARGTVTLYHGNGPVFTAGATVEGINVIAIGRY